MYGNKLKQLIKRKGFSQKEIAQKLKMPESTVSVWMRAEYPQLENIEKVCNILRIPLWQFFMSDDDFEKQLGIRKSQIDMLQAFNRVEDPYRDKFLEIVMSQLDLILSLSEKVKN